MISTSRFWKGFIRRCAVISLNVSRRSVATTSTRQGRTKPSKIATETAHRPHREMASHPRRAVQLFGGLPQLFQHPLSRGLLVEPGAGAFDLVVGQVGEALLDAGVGQAGAGGDLVAH